MALSSAWKQMSWLYYQYLLVTALYMLEPWERTVFTYSLVIGFLFVAYSVEGARENLADKLKASADQA